MKLAASILKSKFDEKETIKKLNTANIDYFHIDVMDGKFTKEKTNYYEHLKLCKKKLNVHLMVENPYEYIPMYSLLNTETITFQYEIDEDIKSIIDYIHERGLKAGLAIKPDTSVQSISKYLKYVDEILIMTVEPGRGGQTFLDSTLYKIEILNKIKKEKKLKFEIWADGGINDYTIKKIKGVDAVVVGSFICMHEDFDEQIEFLNIK